MVEINQNVQPPTVPAKRPPFWAFLLVSCFLSFFSILSFILVESVRIGSGVYSVGWILYYLIIGLMILIRLMIIGVVPSSIFGFVLFKYNKSNRRFLSVLIPFLVITFLTYGIVALYKFNLTQAVFSLPIYLFPLLVPAFTFAYVSMRSQSYELRDFFGLCFKSGLIVLIVFTMFSTLINWQGDFIVNSIRNWRIAKFEESSTYLKVNYLPTNVQKEDSQYLTGDSLTEWYYCSGRARGFVISHRPSDRSVFNNVAKRIISEANTNNSIFRKEGKNIKINENPGYLRRDFGRKIIDLSWNTGKTTIIISSLEGCDVSEGELIKTAESMKP